MTNTDSPISTDRADRIRERFIARAAITRADAHAAQARGDMAAADALSRLAESQERMAAKRYESMRVVGTL